MDEKCCNIDGVPTNNLWKVRSVYKNATVENVQRLLSSYNSSWVVESCDKDRTKVSVGSRQIGDMLLTEMDLSCIHAGRGNALVQNEGKHYVGLVYVYHSEANLVYYGGQTVLDSSCLHAWTTRQMVEFFSDGEFKFVSILIPEDRLLKRIPKLSRSSLVFDAHTAEARLMISHLKVLLEVAKDSNHIQENCISEATIELFASLLRGSAEILEINQPGVALWEEVKEYIREHLMEESLSPKSISGHFRFSVRLLHKLFKQHDLKLMCYVKEQRLEAARQDLLDPFLENLSVTEISYKWAFTNPAHFSHAFKEKFGMSPSAYRSYEDTKRFA